MAIHWSNLEYFFMVSLGRRGGFTSCSLYLKVNTALPLHLAGLLGLLACSDVG